MCGLAVAAGAGAGARAQGYPAKAIRDAGIRPD